MRRGQMKLSFGMIFSIFLIIVFLAVGIYSITKFLEFQRGVQAGQFISAVQTDVDRMWSGSEGSSPQTYRLPGKVDYVCFADFTLPSKGSQASFYDGFELVSGGHENNLFFYPTGASSLDSTKILHVDNRKITSEENPYCIPNDEGKVNMLIKMDLGDSLVTVSR